MTQDTGQDTERAARIQEALQREGLDAVIGTLPADVLLLSGYWPVTGTAIAVATRDGRVGVLAPDDEQALAARGRADPLMTFSPGSLERIETLADAVRTPLTALQDALGITGGRVGYRRGPATEAATYAALHLYGASVLDLLSETESGTTLVPADGLLERLRGVKTPHEVEHIRRACRIAAAAFAAGRNHLRPDVSEAEAATSFRAPLSTVGDAFARGVRADGFVYCMAGADAALASGAYARSRATPLRPGDLVLVHANSYADGYWTDLTRTFSLGEPGARARGLYQAVLEARGAAFAAIAPGARAADVDRAARRVLEGHGLGPHFKHATGHGVGFVAFDPNALPRVHPASEDVLEVGMVFNVEPAVYFDGWGGLRHCDMVCVTEAGYELLTPFQSELESLIVGY